MCNWWSSAPLHHSLTVLKRSTWPSVKLPIKSLRSPASLAQISCQALSLARNLESHVFPVKSHVGNVVEDDLYFNNEYMFSSEVDRFHIKPRGISSLDYLLPKLSASHNYENEVCFELNFARLTLKAMGRQPSISSKYCPDQLCAERTVNKYLVAGISYLKQDPHYWYNHGGSTA